MGSSLFLFYIFLNLYTYTLIHLDNLRGKESFPSRYKRRVLRQEENRFLQEANYKKVVEISKFLPIIEPFAEGDKLGQRNVIL